MTVITCELAMFQEVLSQVFPKQHDSHMTEWYVYQRNQAATAASDRMNDMFKKHGVIEGLRLMIRLHRHITGLPLKDSKDAIDMVMK